MHSPLTSLPTQSYPHTNYTRTHARTHTHHVSFLSEDGIIETLQCHPLEGQSHILPVSLSEVASIIHVLSQTKVTHSDITTRVKPIIL